MKEKIIYSKFASERNQEYAIRTNIVVRNKEKYVKKSPLYDAGKEHIQAMKENYDILANIYGSSHIAKCKLNNENELYMEYISGETLSAILAESIKNQQMEIFWYLLNRYVKFIKRMSNMEEALSSIGYGNFRSHNRISNIDMLFDNIIVQNGEFVIIDYEWLIPAVGYKNILYRAVDLFFIRSQLCDFGEIKKEILKKYDISLTDTNYEDMDKLLFSKVFNNASCRYQKQIINTFTNYNKCNTVTIFISQDCEYTCEDAIFMEAQTVCKDEYFISIDLRKYNIKSCFRFDPLEGSYCKFEILSIETNAQEYSVCAYNANFRERDEYLFLTVDPIVEFLGDFEKATYFNIHYKLTVIDFDKAIQELKNSIIREQNTLASADVLSKKIQAIEQSRGYRALEKFRTVKSNIIKST